jgi:hypothetical protein
MQMISKFAPDAELHLIRNPTEPTIVHYGRRAEVRKARLDFCEFHVLIRTDDPQHHARRITHHMRRGKLLLLPTSLQFATAHSEDVLHPFRLATVGERNDEAVRSRKTFTGAR